MMSEFASLRTESTNQQTKNIDKLDSLGIAKAINEQDKTVADAVEKALPEIAKGIDLYAEVLSGGGRVFYVGAGTSGRLGVLDASECPPTYGVSAETVQGIIAGGRDAAFDSIEDAEDDPESIVRQLKAKDFCEKDVCIGLSASGSAACVQNALVYARSIGAKTMCVSCNSDSALIPLSDVAMIAVVGAEVINGSTRMKAGTAQKMILNMLSTGGMVRTGRVRGNYMAYMVPSNKKLVDRAIRIICDETGCDYETAREFLKKHKYMIADAIDDINSNK
ncbi:MAG: N-acetylmuramic acid 6-phosphate etherase [Clostridia bacterium]|nr:N-acetylmuramic acid 6-phosphate etherase [Clostridia bacterium]